MLIVVQFPIADLRPFIPEDERVPVVVNFSTADLEDTRDYGGCAKPPYLSSVGPLRKRRQGADYYGESLYFKGRSALKFDDSLCRVANPRGGSPIGIEVFFRRFLAFHHDDHQLACYELGFILDLDGVEPLDASCCEALLRTCLALPVSVPGDRLTGPLAKAGPRLASHVLRATTYRKKPNPPSWVMRARTPMVLLEYGEQEVTEPLPRSVAVPISEAPELRLAATSLSVDDVQVKAWCLCSDPDRFEKLSWCSSNEKTTHRNDVRQLRINLFRHHAEREVCARVIECILKPGRLNQSLPTLARADLDKYLIHAAACLTHSSRFGFTQSGIEAAARAVDGMDRSRLQELQRHLVDVLDPKMFAKLYDVLKGLPMGSWEEKIKLKELLSGLQGPPLKVAISYSHEDTRLMQSFTSHMEDAARRGLIDAWDDRWILSGSDWSAEIDRRFSEAHVVVLLISNDFLDPKSFCMKYEVPLVLGRKARKEAVVVPVVVRKLCSSLWEGTDLQQKTQAVLMPNGRPVVGWGNRSEAWRIVIHQILLASRSFFPIPADLSSEQVPSSNGVCA